MEIKVNKSVYEAIGEKGWASIGVDESGRMSWQKHFYINLAQWPLGRAKKLHALLVPQKKGSRAVGLLLRDVETWINILERGDKVTCRSAQQFNALFIETMRKTTKRLYFKDEEKGVWFAYYVESTRYVPPKVHRDRDYDSDDRRATRTWTEPAKVYINLRYTEFGVRQSEMIKLEQHDIVGKDPLDVLAEEGWYIETDDLRAEYLAEVERYNEIAGKVGHQVLGTGEVEVLSRDVHYEDDDNRYRWWSHYYGNVKLDAEGEPTKLVVDTEEKDTEKSARNESKLDLTWWARTTKARKLDSLSEAEAIEVEDEDEDDEDEKSPEQLEMEAMGKTLADADDAEAIEEIEVPVHMLLVCYDLRRYARVKLHVGQITDYVYDTTLGERLILPNDVRDLVGMLVNSRSAFKDAIASKGGGAAILCAGPPGTGKTLTAEVYSEVMKKPLYSVQAAQLGIGEAELEKNLLKCFKRAERWNAILLIDEADVYVMRRGESVAQNAIVATFLRVLEYYQGILFFTTNRAELVDDAIASRCIARIDYRIPHPNDQARIWRVMATQNEIEMSDELIAQIVEKHSDLSGRDIKNVMKLARLVSKTKKKPIDVEMIDFVRKFKPTGKAEGEVEETEGGGLVIEKAARAPRRMEG